jgi:cytoplasmic iron level regulating protein YaaA (DUF328/UPF0246 family)
VPALLAVISPAKSLDTTSAHPPVAATVPRFLDQAAKLARAARRLKASDLKAMMGISDKLAALNVDRFKAFATPFTSDNARPALYTFNGDVYAGLDAATLDDRAVAFAQEHLRILSGLYGLLRPFDLMQPYRLEMGVRFAAGGKDDLYGYWGNRIADALAEELRAQGDPTLVNLASQEYFAAVRPKRLPGRVITAGFKQMKDGVPRFESFAAKRARGMMARFLCEQRIDRPEGLKDFAADGYAFQPAMSDDTNWVFVR